MKIVLRFLLFSLSSAGLAQAPSWHSTDGPYTGVILAVASDSGNYILGRDDSGVFRSSDDGLSWVRVSDIPATSSFAINGNLAFVGERAGISRSTDAGVTWTKVFSLAMSEEYEYVSSLCITSEGHVLAGTNLGGIFRSTNVGDDWAGSTAGFGLNRYSIPTLLSDEQNRIFAVSDGYVFLSSNDGVNWTQQNPAPNSPPFNSLTINKQGMLFAGSDGGGVYRSTDSGQTWLQVNSGLGNTHVQAVHATSSGRLYAGTAGDGLYVSTDNGGQWDRRSNGLASLDINCLSSDVGGCVFAGSSDGFYKSTNDGTSWAQINSGLANAYTYSIGFDPRDNVYAGTSRGLFQSSDHGQSWVRNSLDLGFVYSVAFKANGLGFAAGDVGVYRTTDGGQRWLRLDSFVTFSYSVIFHSGGFVFAGDYRGLFRSTDDGITWTTVGERLINNLVIGLASSDRYIFAGSDQGRMFRSGDLGDTWDQIQTDSSNGTIGGISIHPNGDVFASTFYGGILRSTNNGNGWTYVAFRDTVTALAINADGILFAGTIYGIFRSSDEGATWKPTNSGLTNLQVRAVAIDSRGYAFIGTIKGAVFASVKATTSVDQTINAPPRQYVLYQNYPNPFNPSTTIKYELPKASRVSVMIFDILGRQVITLVNQLQRPGAQHITFNASRLPSGIYFYRLQADTYVEAKKMLYIR